MHADHSILQIIAHVMIASFFIYIGICNLSQADRHVAHFTELKIPFPKLFLACAFGTQFSGALLVLFDYRAATGAALLLVFTVLSELLYHRYWRMTDAFLRMTHRNYFWNNMAVMGGLLLVIQG